ncbi:MAG TPA: DMT family transporter [Acidimicrobiales bacterium]|nr:DMT family transporter [Acidimicrobiales bacterium]
MAAVMLGLVIAACFGSGDFVGGVASSRASTAGVLLVSQAASAVGALALALIVHGHPETTDLLLGAAAGASNVIGLALLYGALARHSAGVVAPVAAMVGAAVPVAWGFAQGERPSALVIVGVCAAVAAGGLISLAPSGGRTRGRAAAGTVRAIAAGAALGVSLVLFDQTGQRSGQWPVLAARLTAAAGAAAVCAFLARRSSVRLPRGGIGVLACGAGALDVAATALLVVAVRRELLVVVAPLASLGPAFTVLWAWRLQGERLHRWQVAGLGCALVGLALMSSG